MAGGARVLDLGCGTGLCGEHLRPLARHLAGVDLSRGMLARAWAKGLYDRLVEGDIVNFLEDQPARTWDLIVAADVFIYVGDLVPLLRPLSSALGARGRFLFSIEAAGGGAAEHGYELHASGRYRHAEAHVRRIIAGHGLVVDHVEDTTVRMERGVPVTGWIFAASKP
jgi:predicted TPR repeat methyltransferase